MEENHYYLGYTPIQWRAFDREMKSIHKRGCHEPEKPPQGTAGQPRTSHQRRVDRLAAARAGRPLAEKPNAIARRVGAAHHREPVADGDDARGDLRRGD